MNELIFLEEENKWEDPIECALCEKQFLWWIFYFFQRCCYCGARGHLLGNNGCIWIDGKPLTALARYIYWHGACYTIEAWNRL